MIKKIIPFVPAKNYFLCKSFFEDLGFKKHLETDEFTEFKSGSESFYLQNFYVKEWAKNCVIKLWVHDLDSWSDKGNFIITSKKYPEIQMLGPKMFPWGLQEIHLIDPSGVLWQFALIAENTP
ncbi:MAG: glyoxalase [Oligoflexales bacterium]